MTEPHHVNARIMGAAPTPLDYCVLVANVQASQLSTATARAGGHSVTSKNHSEPQHTPPLTQILLGARDWQQAVLAQQGSFNPLFACGAEQV